MGNGHPFVNDGIISGTCKNELCFGGYNIETPASNHVIWQHLRVSKLTRTVGADRLLPCKRGQRQQEPSLA